MPSCPSPERLVRLLDEELDEADEAVIVVHVETCPGCQRRLEELICGGPANPHEREPKCAEDSPSDFLQTADTVPDTPAASADTADLSTNQVLDPLKTCDLNKLPATQPVPSEPGDPITELSYEADTQDGHKRNAAQIPGYEILEKLGQGGMGVVYKARQRGLNRLVALKMIIGGSQARDDHLARFRVEAEAVARLRHAHILQIYDIGEFDNVPFVAIELLEGGDLDVRLAGTPQPGRSAAELVVTLARAVHAAHEAGIIHRDLKPTNILFTDDGVPKITDFGLAKRLDSDSKQTESGQIMGTPSYMAPEQARGDTKDVGPAADIYALGAILYEMLTGRPPFKGETPIETVRQVVDDEPVPPRRLVPKVARDLETISLKCLSKQPRKRYATAAALADDLVRYLEGKPIRARPTPASERAIKWTMRHPVAAIIVALCAAAAFGSGYAGVVYNNYQTQRMLSIATEKSWSSGEVDHAREEMDAGALIKARERLLALQPKIESKTELRVEHDRAGRLLKEIEKSQDQQLARARELARYQEFLDKRGEALFHDLQFADLDPSGHRQATLASARAALAVFAADPTAPDHAWALVQPLPGALSPLQQASLVDDCYDLLLIQSESALSAEGLRILDRAALLRPKPTRAFHLRRAECLARGGDAKGAATESRLAEQTPPANALDHFLTGRAQYARKDIPAAIGQFEAALQMNPDLFWAQVLMASAKLKAASARPGEAAVGLTGCIQRQPKLAWLYILRAHAFGQKDKVQAALDDYRRALALKPGDDLVYKLLVNRGVLYIQAGKLEPAIADLVAAIRLNPEPFQPYLNLAQVHQRQGRTDSAAAELTKAIAHTADPTALAGLHRSRALLHASRKNLSPGERAAAIGDLDEAIRRQPKAGPQTADDQVARGRFLFANRRNNDVLAACDAALKIVADHPEAHALRIAALLDLKRYDDVLSSCEAYLVRGKPTVGILEVRGLARVARKNYSAAVSDFSRALELRPEPDPATRTRLYNQRGWAYQFADAPRLALDDFETSLKLSPDQCDALGGRGLARIRLGMWQPAMQDAEAAIRIVRTLPSATEQDRHIRSQSLFNSARIYAQAVEFAAGTVSREGERAVALYRRCRTRALGLLKEALEQVPDQARREEILSDPALKPLRLAPSRSPGPRLSKSA